MAKKLIVGHQSSLLLYRAAGSGIITAPEPYDAPVKPVDCSARIGDFLESGNVQSLLATGAIDLLTMNDDSKHQAKSCRSHVLTGDLPHGSFRSLGNDILVASPALTVFLLAQTMSSRHGCDGLPWCKELIDNLGTLGKRIALAEIASELCGIYSVKPNGKGDFRRHAAFTSIEEMRRYAASLRRRRDVRLARAALRSASPLSASPRETQLYLVLTAPWPFGYGLPLPDTNRLIVLEDQDLNSDEDCRTIRFSDYFWNKKILRNGRVRRAVVLEYDSNEFHTASAGLTDRQLADQAERRDQIEANGNGYLRIATAHTRNFAAFDNKMHQLAQLLRIDLPERTSDERDAAQNFFRLMFDTKRFKQVGIFR